MDSFCQLCQQFLTLSDSATYLALDLKSFSWKLDPRKIMYLKQLPGCLHPEKEFTVYKQASRKE